MPSSQLGESTFAIEVANISAHGIWLLVGEKEYFLPYENFPWFKDAKVSDILDVTFSHGFHLYWPKLDVRSRTGRVGKSESVSTRGCCEPLTNGGGKVIATFTSPDFGQRRDMSAFIEICQRLSNCGIDEVALTESERHNLDRELDATLERIARCPDLDSAFSALDELGVQQNVLATLLFKHKVQLSDKQRRLVRQFDRSDDPQLRFFVFQVIRNGTFLQEDKPPFCV